jgi:hypothetical protein
MEGQKFLIEICKQLTAEPLLWCVYDDDVGQQQLRQRFSEELEDPKLQAKLLAFAHLHLNMFEIVLVEAPSPTPFGQKKQFKMWVNYFHDTLARSRLIRRVLDEPESKLIWNEKLLKLYKAWTEEHKTTALRSLRAGLSGQ